MTIKPFSKLRSFKIYYTIYKITNIVNNKYYIGKHQTSNLSDNYFGSGKLLKRALQKHGKENLIKEILHVFTTEEEMNAKEKELVVVSEETYNLCDGGKGGFGYINGNKLNNINHEHVGAITSKRESGKKKVFLSEYNKFRHAHGLNKYNNFSGKKHSEESKQKQKIKMIGKIPWNKGKSMSFETKKKISDSLKLRFGPIA